MQTEIQDLSSKKEPGLLRRLSHSISGMVGLVIVTLYIMIAVVGALKATPFPYNEQHPRERLSAPGEEYRLGSDIFGRDILSRIIRGATNSLYVSLLSVALSSAAGTLIGTISAYIGGLFDTILMRIMDIFFAFPAILLALLVVTVLGSGLNNTILAIAVVYTPIFARVARGPVLSVKEMEFVTAARCVG
ncbi:MAG: ABC transporter permease, partial [Anaerolineae bacterium]|nr:ABC transporter permease [Anaerolineae bacterium]